MFNIFLLFVGYKVSQWKEVNSFLSHHHNVEEEKHDEEKEHTNDFESHNNFGGDNKIRKKRDSDIFWHRLSNFFQDQNATKPAEIASLDAVKKALYPGKNGHIKTSLKPYVPLKSQAMTISITKLDGFCTGKA